MQLGAIRAMRERWDVPVGLSDHTLGDTAAIAAVALGACIVEKHFKQAGDDASPDAAFSLDPAGLRRMVDAIRFTESAVAGNEVGPAPAELESRRFRRSLFVVEDVAAGEDAAALRRTIDGLPDDYAAVLRLVYLEGMTLGEAAERMGRSADAVRKTYGRALSRLAERLRGRRSTPA